MPTPRTDPFHGLFTLHAGQNGSARLVSSAHGPRTVPDPETGQPLTIASLELSDRSVCPVCRRSGTGGYVSFVADLRLAFACPSCRKLVWVAGA
jgi:hypothetical protein